MVKHFLRFLLGFGESVSPRFRSADRVFLERVAHVTQEAVVFATFATKAQTVIHANGPVTLLSFNAERAIEHTGAQHVLLELSTRVDDLGTLVTDKRAGSPSIYWREECEQKIVKMM